jgi:hypothetical protein
MSHQPRSDDDIMVTSFVAQFSALTCIVLDLFPTFYQFLSLSRLRYALSVASCLVSHIVTRARDASREVLSP